MACFKGGVQETQMQRSVRGDVFILYSPPPPETDIALPRQSVSTVLDALGQGSFARVQRPPAVAFATRSFISPGTRFAV